MNDRMVDLRLTRDEAVVLHDCLARLFGENDLHDWEAISFEFKRECEQWPFFTLQDGLRRALFKEITSSDYKAILTSACRAIEMRQWGEVSDE